MLELCEITEENWLDAARLRVSERQKGFVASAVGILARAYVYRTCRAKALAVSDGGVIVGLMMVRDLDDEPACYELQQFLIDEAHQGRGYGSAVLSLILDMLRAEGKYDSVEVCVKMDDAAAIHVYERAGFKDTGYIAGDAPDSYNLRYTF